MNRHGVALIIAISVLAALLFLALPFVFSQSASVAGARASSWDGIARRGSDRALGLSTALATYATGLHRSPALALQLGTAQLAYVQIPRQVGDLNGPIHYPSDAPNSWRSIIATGEPWTFASGNLPGLDSAQAVHGAIIEDESRRIEPNSLDMYGWAVVLKRAGIQDPWTVEMQWEGAEVARVWVPATPRYSWKRVTFGRLARALTYWRPGNGSRRFNRLEDLLGADPQQPESWYGVQSYLGCVHFGPHGNYPIHGVSGWPVPGQTVEGTREAAEVDLSVKDPTGSGDTSNLGWRVAPLTQAELERLRPLLSFLLPGQGRSGLIDLGTVVASETRSGDWWNVVTDELAPPDTGVVGGAIRTDRTWTHSGTASNRHLNNGWANAGDPLAVDAIPSLNLNTVPSDSGMTRLYLAQKYSGTEPSTAAGDLVFQTRIESLGWSNDPIATPVTSIGRMPLLRWLDPRTGDGTIMFERPPLGIGGFGIVAVEGLATVRDQQGNAVASRRRRTVVQAVPQERPVEAAWTTQGDFETLVRLRHGSWVVAGPHPTSRIADWGADASTGRQDMLALDGPGWLEPAPLTTFSRNPAVAFNWRVMFGLTKAQVWADILKQVDGTGVTGALPVVLPTDSLRATGTAVGALTAQGLRLAPGDGIAYGADGGNDGPLRFNVNTDELSARHLSVRFCLPDDPVGTTTILDVRSQLHGQGATDPDVVTPSDAASESQSLWRVEYRHAERQLVLIIANAARPWTAADRTALNIAWTTMADLPSAVSDGRCRPGAFPFAPADPAERVEFRYQIASPGLQKGRWYHLQAFCASDRPGLHGLILDGVVGRDATQTGVDQTRTGDHYTYPCLRLATAVDMVTPSSAANPAAELAKPVQIAVQFPVTVPLAKLLPERGIIRIDDEYISFTSWIDNGDGTGSLGGIQRARRINTNQDASEDANGDGTLNTEDANANGVLDVGEDANTNGVLDTEDANRNGLLDSTSDPRRWPVTQRHEVGAIVTPGWAQVELQTGRWLRGSAHLVQPMQAEPPEAVVAAPSGGWPNVDADLLPEFSNPASVALTSETGVWPSRGYVRFDVAGTIRRAAFTYSAGALTLDWAPPETTGGMVEFPAGTVITCRVVSIEVDGLFDHDGMLQLLSPDDGRCEWIRVDRTADRTGQPIDGRYFIHDQGWSMVPYPTPKPLQQPRGAMRTGWTDTDPAWAAPATLVLPVQTHLDGDRFESGDVVTFVRRTINDAGPPVARILPVQAVIRHAARDGYPTVTSDSGDAWDTRNEWFAFAHAVPANLLDPQPAVPPPSGDSTSLIALIGRGWGGDDLSPVANSPQRRGALPRLNLLIRKDGEQAKVFVGSADTLAGSVANANAVLLDDLCAGPLQGPADANAAATSGSVNGSEIIEINGSATGAITAIASALPIAVRASTNVFAPVNGRSMYGLVLIDGEAFAFRRDPGDNSRADLIARAMLGTTAVAHTLANAAPTVPLTGATPPSRTVRPSLPVVALPVGPVAELCSDLPAGAHDVGLDVVEAQYANYYKDPAQFDTPSQDSYADDPGLIMSPPFVLCHDPADGATAEILRLFGRPASHQRITAGWLRGLFGTPDVGWTAPYTPSTHVASWSSVDPGARPVAGQTSGVLNPILIGWWPRFAPALPGAIAGMSPLTQADKDKLASALRSRSFAWAGFALRLSGSRFDGHVSTGANDPGGAAVLLATAGGIADVGVASDGGCPLFASALAAEEVTGKVFDWDNAWAKRRQLALAPSANAALTDPFDWLRFQLREVDGAELRVHWEATAIGTSDLIKAGDAGGRAPRLENVRLRCVAPNRVLAVEEVR